MTVQLIVDNIEVPVKVIKFSDGGTNIKLEVPEQLKKYPPNAYFSISVDPSTPVDNYLWEILLTLSAIYETWKEFEVTYLKLPYLPHGRADRVFEEGNAFPLNIFLSTVLKYFDKVSLTDPHSDYYKSFYRCPEEVFIVKEQHQCFIEVCGREVQSGDILIAPDKGSLKKIYKLQEVLASRNINVDVVEASKKRDIETGRIIETTLPNFDYNDKIVWIVDDLLDAGGTFIPLAKLLKGKGVSKVNLYVTHFIGAKGLDMFKGIIDNIYTYQTVGSYVNRIDIDNFNKGI